ncbi:MAG TPA: hypothetical protein PKE08_00310 [Candidatus Paceibacterota bacterium]|nr:hypothetical protein [Candidatus Paceibacterota bacterium]
MSFDIRVNSQTSSENVLPFVQPTSITLNGDVYNAGEILSGSFEVKNSRNFIESDIYYRISVDGNYDENGVAKMTYLYNIIGPENFKPLESKIVNFSIKLPEAIRSEKDAGIKIRVTNKDGISLGFIDQKIEIKNSAQFFDVLNPKILVIENDTNQEQEFFVSEGPFIYENEKVFLTFTIVNSSNLTHELYPQTAIFERDSNRKDPINIVNQDKILLSPNESKKVLLNLPTNKELGKNVFLSETIIRNQDNKIVSPMIPARYIVSDGDLFVIHHIKHDKNYISAGEILNINIFASGNPLDMREFFLNQGNIEDREGSVEVYVISKNEKGDLIGELKFEHDFYQQSIKDVQIKSKVNSNSIETEVILSKDGNILAKYSSKTINDEIIFTNQNTIFNLIKNNWFYILMLIILLILIILFLLSKKNLNNKTVLILAFVLLIVLGLIYLSKMHNANAYSQRHNLIGNRYIIVTANAIPNQTPGSKFSTSGSISFWACNNGFNSIKSNFDNNRTESWQHVGGGTAGSTYYFTGYTDYSRNNLTAPNTTGTKNINYRMVLGCIAGTSSCGSSDWWWEAEPAIGSYPYVVKSFGQCHPSAIVAGSTAPQSPLCLPGSSSSLSGSGPWTWTCHTDWNIVDNVSYASCERPYIDPGDGNSGGTDDGGGSGTGDGGGSGTDGGSGTGDGSGTALPAPTISITNEDIDDKDNLTSQLNIAANTTSQCDIRFTVTSNYQASCQIVNALQNSIIIHDNITVPSSTLGIRSYSNTSTGVGYLVGLGTFKINCSATNGTTTASAESRQLRCIGTGGIVEQ